MAVTGKTGADGIAKALKRQVIIASHYGPKFLAVCAAMKALGLLTDPEYTAIVTAFNAWPALLSAIQKVADYSGF